jgi:hypothetical protein
MLPTPFALPPPRVRAGAKWFGCAFGMGFGCLLGLVPLLLIDTEANHQHGRQQKGEAAAQAKA